MALVEEIARAIAAADLDTNEDNWSDWLPEAQAALSVILQRLREPDEGMEAALNKMDILRAIADHLEGK